MHGGHEASDAGITTSVSVDNLLLGDSGDRDFHVDGLFAFTLTDVDNDGLSSLSDDRDTISLGVGLLELAHVLTGSTSIGSLESLFLSKSAGLIFVAEDVIGVLNSVHHIIEVGEEEEGSSDVENHRLIVISTVFTNLSHSFNVGSNEESSGVDHVGGGKVAHVFIEMSGGVLARGSKVSAESTLFSNDDTSARSSRGLGINGEDGLHVVGLAAVRDNSSVLIVSDTSEVGDTSGLSLVLLENVGSSTGRVESSTTGRGLA